MDRVRSARPRRRVPRTRLPIHRRILSDPAALRRWLLVLALAAAAAGLVGSVVSRAEAARHRWGETRQVLVTARAVEPGDSLSSAVTVAEWPVALVPSKALTDLPTGARAATAVGQGVAVTPEAVDDPRGPGGDGRRIALPVGPAPIPVEPGDRVEVWATTDPSLAGGSLATRRVATDATVTSADDTAVVVSVSPEDVPDVAEAAALATVTLVAMG